MTRTLPFLAAMTLALGFAACDSGTGSGIDLPDSVGFDTLKDATELDVAGDTASDRGDSEAALPDTAPEDVTTPDTTPPDVPADPGTPDATTDLPLADVAPEDVPPSDAAGDPGTDTTVPPTTIGHLTVGCDVPFVLDASQVTSQLYMISHFSDLVQEYCITGTVGGVDLTSWPEKMFYGSHPADDAYLTLTQASMNQSLSPQYSVRIDFVPDSAVTTGSQWPVGLDDGNAVAMVIKHTSTTTLCVAGVGTGGTLTFTKATGVTQVEGGSFTVSGAFDVADPKTMPGVCESLGTSGCCP